MNCSVSYSACGTRAFLTKAEKLEMLGAYKRELEQEAQGVGERIAQLEKDE